MCNRLSATYSKPLVRRSTITCQPLVGLGALHMKQTEYDIPKAPYGDNTRLYIFSRICKK